MVKPTHCVYGSTLRALIKYLDRVADADISQVEGLMANRFVMNLIRGLMYWTNKYFKLFKEAISRLVGENNQVIRLFLAGSYNQVKG